MSLEFVRSGDMRDDPADFHVVAVNLRGGVMGKGQAKAYADRWPTLKDQHRHVCDINYLRLDRGACLWEGRPDLATGESVDFRVFLLATKDDWRKPSQLEWVASGLDSLVECVQRINESHRQKPWACEYPVKSIACPALGSGLGGLDWRQVRPLIEAAAEVTPGVYWRVYQPGAERRTS